MEEVKVKIVADTGKAQKNIEGVNDSLQETGKGAKSATADVSEMGNQLDKTTGGAITKFKGLTGTLKGAVRGFKTLKGAIFATGIGALAIAIGALIQSFKSSEEGQNRFAKIMSQIGVVVGNVSDIISNLGESVFAAGKALIKLAKGDLKGAAMAWSEVKENIKETSEGIANFGEETRKEIKVAGDLANARARADKLERALLVDRAEADRKRAELLEKAVDRENFTTQQRIKFLEEAGKLEEQITNQEIEAAKIRLQTKIQENSLSNSTKEDLVEQATLQAELIRLETARLTKQKEVTGQVIALKNEEKAARDAEAAEIQAAQDKIDADNQIEIDKELAKQLAIENIQKSFILKLEDFKAIKEEDRLALEEQRALADLERLGGTEEQKAEIIAFYAAKNKKLSEDQTKDQEALDQAVGDAKKDVLMQGLSLLQDVAGEGSGIAKAAAIAQATIAGVEGVQNAFKTANASPVTALFPAYPYIQAGLAAAFSAKNIKAIASTKVPGGGGGGGGAVAPVSAPPAFNVVGAAPENQLAETISGQDKKPVKAFVVSTEVSNEQALNRQIETEASIG
tara:strand:+ start:3341 stop:5053 length:1713 start_codon:yes stop_codon:yes gene_type:complete